MAAKIFVWCIWEERDNFALPANKAFWSPSDFFKFVTRMAKNRTSISAGSNGQCHASRSPPKTKAKRPSRKAKNNSVVANNGRRGSGKGVNINHNSSCKVKTKYQEKHSAAENARKCQDVKNSCNQIPVPKYESELERTLRLQMAKFKPLHQKQIRFKGSTTLASCSPRQVSPFSQIANASHPCSDSNLKVSPIASKKRDKVYSPVDSLTPTKPKTVNIWKFNDGTTVKKVY